MEARADAPPRDLELLYLAVRLECGAQAFVVHSGHDEIRVLRFTPEELVAHRAADEVGVEVEAPDEVLDCAIHYCSAIASISTSRPGGSFATSKVERAGGSSPTCLA